MVKKEFNPRKFMEIAIKVMRDSVSEPRNDGKTIPRVGAVLLKSDGNIETASRGELRDGDHAEYTLLERKNRDQKLDNSILFATLEPCAPGARNHPKLSCAERIVLARIKEVWVGIEDPDPKVDRKGIKHLQDKGVTVHMFDRDLQEIIRQENKEFIEQAMERADSARKESKSKDIKLSSLENILKTVSLDDFSEEALKEYRSIANINEQVDSLSFKRRLVQQGLLKQEKKEFKPTGFGLLLFGKEPRTVMPQAGLLGTINYPDGTEETFDFDGPMVQIPKQVEQWLNEKLPSIIDRSHMQRNTRSAMPFELIREAVVNALVHRDYEIKGSKCQLVVTPDTINIKSPGEPLSPITLEQLKNFKAPMLSRNPELHYVFSQMDLAEERGLGMKTLQSLPERYNLPLPLYSFDNPYLTLTLYRSSGGAIKALEPKVLLSLNEDEKVGWEFLTSKVTITKKQYVEHMGFDDRKAQRHLKKFVDSGLLRKVGSGPSTSYEIVRQ